MSHFYLYHFKNVVHNVLIKIKNRIYAAPAVNGLKQHQFNSLGLLVMCKQFFPTILHFNQSTRNFPDILCTKKDYMIIFLCCSKEFIDSLVVGSVYDKYNTHGAHNRQCSLLSSNSLTKR